ncbi:unnamed protein product [Rhizophagus irregularis]|nr:unnamed protein product [Rhizophagus irregularis]CAB4480555.1 unnamed protein product [Rhizophagus irregularis]
MSHQFQINLPAIQEDQEMVVDEETQPDSSSKNKYISGENPLARKLGIWLIWTIHTLKKLIEELSSETLIHTVQLLRWKSMPRRH